MDHFEFEALDATPAEQCPHCKGTNTKWVFNRYPDPQCDFPRHDLVNDTVFVNLARYCNDCKWDYKVRLYFNIRDGRRVEY